MTQQSHDIFIEKYQNLVLENLELDSPYFIDGETLFCDFLNETQACNVSFYIDSDNSYNSGLAISLYDGLAAKQYLEPVIITCKQVNLPTPTSKSTPYWSMKWDRNLFPQWFIEHLKDNGFNRSNKIHDFIAALQYKITPDKNIHHINWNSLNNNINNLFPINKEDHRNYFHYIPFKCCRSPELIELGYKMKKDYDKTLIFKEKKRVRTSFYDDELVICTILYLRYVKSLTVPEILNINSKMIPKKSQLYDILERYKHCREINPYMRAYNINLSDNLIPYSGKINLKAGNSMIA